MKFLKRFTLITLICLLIPAFTYAGATFSRTKTWSSSETLTASDLNAEFNNILNNLLPAGIDDESASDAAAQAVSDPYPGGSLSKATSLQGEIQQIRYLLKQLTGESYWYVDPDFTMVTLATHAARHITSGADEINGDKLDIDWNPTYYTPAVTPSQVSVVDHLTAHLYGIDRAFAFVGITSVSATTYSVLSADQFLNITSTPSVALALTLPTDQCTAGRIITIKDAGYSASTNNITIDTEGAEKIDNADTFVINYSGDSISVYSDGTNWHVY